MTATGPVANLSSGEAAPVMSLRDIVKEYPGVVALDHVSLDVRPHEVLGLIGENGAGKSTLMKLMIGLAQPDAGTIALRGQAVKLLDPADAIRHGVGMVFQEGSLIPNLSISDNLFLCHEGRFLRRRLISAGAVRAEARQVLAEVQLDADPDARVDDLTPAARQMVEIGRLLWLSRLYGQQNPIVILDEPTTVLTDRERETLFRIIGDLKAKASVVLISHRLQEVLEHSDRVAILKDGRNVADLPAAGLAIHHVEELMVGHGFSEDRYREVEQKPPAGRVVLEVRGLARRGAFEPISFQVHAGEIVSLVGLVGSGKEALARCLNGLERPDAGELRVDGAPLPPGNPSRAVRRGVGCIPIDRRADGLALGMSVADNVNLLVLERLRAVGFLSPARERANAQRWIASCRIKTPSAASLVGNLSGGNQQKVVIAKWLTSQVRLLVLDHPTRGVDVGAKEEIYGLVRELSAAGVAMIVMCDTLEEDIGLCHRMLILKDGRLVKELECAPGAKPGPRDIIQHVV